MLGTRLNCQQSSFPASESSSNSFTWQVAEVKKARIESGRSETWPGCEWAKLWRQILCKWKRQTKMEDCRQKSLARQTFRPPSAICFFFRKSQCSSDVLPCQHFTQKLFLPRLWDISSLNPNFPLIPSRSTVVNTQDAEAELLTVWLSQSNMQWMVEKRQNT